MLLNSPIAVLPMQSFGLGDIIFSQYLVREIAGDLPIIWGTEPYFIDGLQEAYPSIKFINKSLIPQSLYNVKEHKLIGGFLLLPIRWADSIIKLPYSKVMRAKYDLYGFDYKLWDTVDFCRNKEKEDKLFYDVLGLHEGMNYILKNTKFRSNSSGLINIPNKNKNSHIVDLKQIDGYSLFNWAKVIENSEEIHTVSTAINYIIELLKYKNKIYIYRRIPDEPTHDNYSYIFTNENVVYV